MKISTSHLFYVETEKIHYRIIADKKKYDLITLNAIYTENCIFFSE